MGASPVAETGQLLVDEQLCPWFAASGAAMAESLGVARCSVSALEERVVADGLVSRDLLDGVTRIGIDEIVHRRRSRYLQRASDHDTVLIAASGLGPQLLEQDVDGVPAVLDCVVRPGDDLVCCACAGDERFGDAFEAGGASGGEHEERVTANGDGCHVELDVVGAADVGEVASEGGEGFRWEELDGDIDTDEAEEGTDQVGVVAWRVFEQLAVALSHLDDGGVVGSEGVGGGLDQGQ